jgi:hypothetical protein
VSMLSCAAAMLERAIAARTQHAKVCRDMRFLQRRAETLLPATLLGKHGRGSLANAGKSHLACAEDRFAVGRDAP